MSPREQQDAHDESDYDAAVRAVRRMFVHSPNQAHVKRLLIELRDEIDKHLEMI